MKKVIPEQIEYYCDRCSVLMNCANRKHIASIKINVQEPDHMLEYRGAPTKYLDLCDECYLQLKKYMQMGGK